MMQALADRQLERSNKVFPPGSTIGLFGSGQLGRMFTHAAQRLGYRVRVFSEDSESPTGQAADHEFVASYEDQKAVQRFAEQVDVITLEFENVPVAAAELAAEIVPVRPSATVLHTLRNRNREKSFLRSIGIGCTPFRQIGSLSDLQRGLRELGTPAVLKTAEEGYDGKGQVRIDAADQADSVWHSGGQCEAILESFIDFDCELSVVAARGEDGSMATFGPVMNHHRNHILDISISPCSELEDVAELAEDVARTILDDLGVIGLICVEFFRTTDGELLVNEIAPRPHNSGHYTIDACVTSQFEQHVRAVCGLPLGSTRQIRPAAMANLLGDLWKQGEPDWSRALEIPEVSLHLYGKAAARPGRKMGHLTALADTPMEAEQRALTARQTLSRL